MTCFPCQQHEHREHRIIPSKRHNFRTNSPSYKPRHKHILHKSLKFPSTPSQLPLLIPTSLPCSLPSSVDSTPAMVNSFVKMHPVVVVMAAVMVILVQVTLAQEAVCPSNDLTACMPAAYADIQPTEECCTNLAAYTETATPAECLCQGALSSPLAGDDDVNVQFAVLIPQKCSLHYPANTICRGYVIP